MLGNDVQLWLYEKKKTTTTTGQPVSAPGEIHHPALYSCISYQLLIRNYKVTKRLSYVGNFTKTVYN